MPAPIPRRRATARLANPALALALAVLAGPVLAGEELPASLTDGSSVTLEEVRRNSEPTFRAFAGADGGPVSRQAFVETELPEGVGPAGRDPQLLGRLFDRLDADGDGRLTRREWDEQIESDLAFADENEDGRVTLEELSNARENMGIGDAVEMVF